LAIDGRKISIGTRLIFSVQRVMPSPAVAMLRMDSVVSANAITNGAIILRRDMGAECSSPLSPFPSGERLGEGRNEVNDNPHPT